MLAATCFSNESNWSEHEMKFHSLSRNSQSFSQNNQKKWHTPRKSNMEPKNHLNWNPETPLPNLHCWGVPAVNFPGFLLGMLKLSRFNLFGFSTCDFSRMGGEKLNSTLGAPDIWWQRATNPLPDEDLWVPPRWVANRRTQPGGWLVPGGLGTGDKLIFAPIPGCWEVLCTHFKKDSREVSLGFTGKKKWVTPFEPKKQCGEWMALYLENSNWLGPNCTCNVRICIVYNMENVV